MNDQLLRHRNAYFPFKDLASLVTGDLLGYVTGAKPLRVPNPHWVNHPRLHELARRIVGITQQRYVKLHRLSPSFEPTDLWLGRWARPHDRPFTNAEERQLISPATLRVAEGCRS